MHGARVTDGGSRVSRVMIVVSLIRSRGSVFGKTTQYRSDEPTKSSALRNSRAIKWRARQMSSKLFGTSGASSVQRLL